MSPKSRDLSPTSAHDHTEQPPPQGPNPFLSQGWVEVEASDAAPANTAEAWDRNLTYEQIAEQAKHVGLIAGEVALGASAHTKRYLLRVGKKLGRKAHETALRKVHEVAQRTAAATAAAIGEIERGRGGPSAGGWTQADADAAEAAAGARPPPLSPHSNRRHTGAGRSRSSAPLASETNLAPSSNQNARTIDIKRKQKDTWKSKGRFLYELDRHAHASLSNPGDISANCADSSNWDICSVSSEEWHTGPTAQQDLEQEDSDQEDNKAPGLERLITSKISKRPWIIWIRALSIWTWIFLTSQTHHQTHFPSAHTIHNPTNNPPNPEDRPAMSSPTPQRTSTPSHHLRHPSSHLQPQPHHQPPDFALEAFADPLTVKDVVKAILHTIFFHRFFPTVIPLEQEILDVGISVPKISDQELETLIESYSAQVARQLDAEREGSGRFGGGTGTGLRTQVCVVFRDKKRRTGGRGKTGTSGGKAVGSPGGESPTTGMAAKPWYASAAAAGLGLVTNAVSGVSTSPSTPTIDTFLSNAPFTNPPMSSVSTSNAAATSPNPSQTDVGDEIVWERWTIRVSVAEPKTEAERFKVRRAAEQTLQGTIMKIVSVVNEHKEHIPPITTTEQNPFGYAIEIGTGPAGGGGKGSRGGAGGGTGGGGGGGWGTKLFAGY
ncbi:DUF1649 domain protein [Zalerion maritima]|uniref:Autophagy-related protein 101 n=1 Tax=Zalerion maritima TaxID=339359 RepID=A0AAD5WV55_9PEZI|nr:DUF1649 domain protein [Zalerion maritima]